MYSVFVYYFPDCIEACARWPTDIGLDCVAVSYGWNSTIHPAAIGDNCWLKGASGGATANSYIDSAIMKRS